MAEVSDAVSVYEPPSVMAVSTRPEFITDNNEAVSVLTESVCTESNSTPETVADRATCSGDPVLSNVPDDVSSITPNTDAMREAESVCNPSVTVSSSSTPLTTDAVKAESSERFTG